MALLVEDGTGVFGANSYCSLAYADAHHLARGNTAWADAVIPSDREAALVRATDFMESRFALRWAGLPFRLEQTLSWPRAGVPMPVGSHASFRSVISYVATNVVPEEIRRACAEFALKTLQGVELYPQPSQQVKRIKVGEIEKEYALGSAAPKEHASIEALFMRFLCEQTSMIRVVRG